MCALVWQWLGRRSVGRTVVLCAAMLVFAVGGARAEDHFWSALWGGSFNYWENWVPQWVPQEDDRAIFELEMDPAYVVTFYESATTAECLFRTDQVIFDLGGFTYTLVHPGFALIVGEGDGHVAEVVLYNGTIDTTVTHVGLWDGSIGTLVLEADAILNISDHLLVGNDGDGMMNVHDGATVTTQFAGVGGHDFGNTGVLYVEGPDAEFTVTETLRVGVEGSGYFHLRNGANAHVTRGYVGDAQLGYGELYITLGARFVMDEWLMTGGFGDGSLTVREAGRLELPTLSVAREIGSYGAVDLFHVGSSIDASQYIFVGDRGCGIMDVTQQADLTAAELRVGASETAQGDMFISGAGTTVTVQNNLFSGHFGVGVLTITNGAEVRTTTPAGWVFVGQRPGSDGYVLVDAGSTLTAENAPLVVGEEGQGWVDIYSGGEVHTSGELFMGWRNGSVGQMVISGNGSKYTSDSGYPARVGDEGEGTLLIEDGGRFEKPGAFFLGIGSTGVGTVTLSGNTCVFKGEQLSVGEYGSGTFTINDGHVALGDVDPAAVPSGEMHLAGYFTQLTGTGTVTGDVSSFGSARVMPGGDEAAALTGVLTIDGSYAQGDGRLTIKVKGLLPGDEYSRLHVSGTASLDGELQIMPIEGFVPQSGDEFVVLTAGAVDGTFSAVTGPNAYVVTYYPDHVTVTVTNVCLGDLNCDGSIDFGDINPFVLYLSNFASWQAANPGCPPANGDINCDGTYGQASFGDINPFVALMTQCGTGCSCPGPTTCP